VANPDPALPLAPAQLKGFRGGESTLAGVPQVSMNLAPKTPMARRAPAQESSAAGSQAADNGRSNADAVLSSLLSSPASSAPDEPLIQRAEDSGGNVSSSQGPSGSEPSSAMTSSPFPSMFDEEEFDGDADWKQLADKVYPLIKRMLLLERERMPR
jgi:hypothetical protein